MRFHEVLDRVLTYHPRADLSVIEDAYVFAGQVYGGAVCGPDETLLDHYIDVTGILAQMSLDEESLAAGLLYGTVERGGADLEKVEARFGEGIARIVRGVVKLSGLKYDKREDVQAEYLRKMILSMSRDVRVVFVKLADRLHFLRGFHCACVREDDLSIQEILDIYAPLAARLGIDWMKQGLEDLAFQRLYPEAFERIARSLDKTREERRRYTDEVKEILSAQMEEHGLKGLVLGRSKHMYSIYKKMLRREDRDLERIYDIIAFRVILDSPPEGEEDAYKECYEALAVIQSLWKPVSGRFKDYIAKPKPNGYKSLHTTVEGPYGESMEVQIRTQRMDVVANEGIAAHWLYKENKAADKVDAEETERFSWLRHLLEWKKDTYDPKEFFSAVKVDLYPGEVYVLTPRREVKVLPRGATPVDFAYQIHTEVGHRCVGARVNGKIVPLHYQLLNGDVVEIMTAKQHRPSKDWLKIVKTSKARERIRRWIKMEEWERSVAMGREMCEREFRKKGANFNHYVNSPELEEVARAMSLRGAEDLLASIGFKKISPTHVMGRLLLPEEEGREKEDEPVFDRRDAGAGKKMEEGVRVAGVDDVMIHLAKCCHPLPGEPIVGYITRGRGITVHHAHCKNLDSSEPHRLIEVQWDNGDGKNYPVAIRVVYFGGKGILGTLISLLGQMDANVVDVKMDSSGSQGLTVCRLWVEVRDREHLQRALAALRGEKNVRMVQRSKE